MRVPICPVPFSARSFRAAHGYFGTADFEQVYKRGRRHFCTHMTVFFLEREQVAGMRVGFTVAKSWAERWYATG